MNNKYRPVSTNYEYFDEKIIQGVSYIKKESIYDYVYEDILEMNGNYEELRNWHDKKSHIKMELHSMQNTYNHKKDSVPKRTIFAIGSCVTIMSVSAVMFSFPYNLIAILPFSAPLIINCKHIWDSNHNVKN